MNQFFVHIETFKRPATYTTDRKGPYRWRWVAELVAFWSQRRTIGKDGQTVEIYSIAKVSEKESFDSMLDEEQASA